MDSAASSTARTAKGIGGWIWRDYMRRYRGLVVVAVFLMMVEGSILGLLSYMVRPMFDELFLAGNRAALAWIGIGASVAFILRAGAAFAHRVIMVWVGQRVSARLQSDMVGHMLTLDSSFFQENSPGTLMERVRGDTQAVVVIWEVMLSAVARDVISVAALLGVALYNDWVWTLIAVAGVPLFMVPIGVLQKWVRRTTRVSRNVAAGIATRLDEIFHGINTIKLSGTEARENARFEDEVKSYAKAHLHSQANQAGIVAIIDVIGAIGFLGVLSYGGLQIMAGDKTVGAFMSFFAAITLLFEPLRRLGTVSGSWQAALASIERLRTVFDASPTILSPARPETMAVAPGTADIVFEDVHFSYGETPVLRGASFTAKAGQTTALVGASGAGKSTVFHLLTRLADCREGHITIGGAETKGLALGELRALFSVVSQDALLFDESLRDNIVMGREGVSEETLQRALAAAHVTDFLPRMEAGIDSKAGPRGSNLSGGQRQRIAIARAILRDAPILLLDEATSALDAQSEKIVQEALEKLSAGRTTLVIAHRLATVRGADRIIVMDHGRVVDQGSHDELLARGGIYADLYRLQFQEG